MINPKTLNLSELPWLPLEERSAFPNQPAIYFCIDRDNVIQYIGRSVNPKSRWSRHHRYSQLAEIGQIKVCYLFVDRIDLLSEIETALIAWFEPQLNKVMSSMLDCNLMPSEFMNRRKKLGLTQRQIAETVGVTVQTVSNWETGTYQPKLTVEQAEKLCNVLNTDITGLRMIFEAV